MHHSSQRCLVLSDWSILTEDELHTFLGKGSSLVASLARPDQVDRIFLQVGITHFSWSYCCLRDLAWLLNCLSTSMQDQAIWCAILCLRALALWTFVPCHSLMGSPVLSHLNATYAIWTWRLRRFRWLDSSFFFTSLTVALPVIRSST